MIARRSILASLAVAAVVGPFGRPTFAQAGDRFVFFGGRVHLGGEVSGTMAPQDGGYFNYTDYQTSSLRLLRLDLAAEARLVTAASVLAEVRSDNLSAPRVYALYLRLRPWADRAVDVQAGLVPPVFGALPRRRYVYDNPLPSLPLAYQYLTDLRADAVPATAEQLVEQRGKGWLLRYPTGSTEPAPGVPLANAERWDTGVQLRLGREPLSLAVALTQGTLSHPRLRDDNGGKQLSGRLAWKPRPAFTIGLSGAVGEFLSDEALDALPVSARGPFRQQALGADLELARGYWILRGEAVWSRWDLPAVEETRLDSPLDALGAYAELRYKLRPGLYLAGRIEHLGFSEVDSALGRKSWDAPVTRLELGAGYSIRRELLLKASWQHNRRDAGLVRKNDLFAAQVLLWF